MPNLTCMRWLPVVLCGLILAGPARGDGADSANNYTAVPNTFTNGANGGTGFGAWIFDLGEGATAELADSTEATGDVNSPNGYAFRFYGIGENFANATRPFLYPFNSGDTLSFKMAYNYNGGVRGMSLLRPNGELMYLQFRGGDELAFGFEGGEDVVLNAAYLPDSVLAVSITQLADNRLDVLLARNDGWTTNFTSEALPGPANGIKFYNGDHEADDVRQALYVNDLEIVDGPTLRLFLAGRQGLVVGQTNWASVRRTGPATGELAVAIGSGVPGVVLVPASLVIPDGNAFAEFAIAGIGQGQTTIAATAPGFESAALDMEVFEVAYDDSSYYPAAGAFTNGSNGGAGFGPWIFQENAGSYEGHDNYAGAFLGNSTEYLGGNVNSDAGHAFGLYANQSGDDQGTNAPFFHATRSFPRLAVGQEIALDLGVNSLSGYKGVRFELGEAGLFKFEIGNSGYWTENMGGGGPYTRLDDFPYDPNTAIRVTLLRKTGDFYDIAIVRSGALASTNRLDGIYLGGAPDRVRFYISDTQAGGEHNLYLNRLAIDVPRTDGIPNAWWDQYGVAASNRWAAEDTDEDTASNADEYAGDTDPTDGARSFRSEIMRATGNFDTLALQVGPNTTNSRVYDVWWSADLEAVPQTWTRVGLNARAAPDGGPLEMVVTNELPWGFYRTGVRIE